jgi:hypothetical protein
MEKKRKLLFDYSRYETGSNFEKVCKIDLIQWNEYQVGLK